MLEFKLQRVNEDGEKLYRFMIDGAEVAKELTLDEVIAEIHRRDEASLGERHGGKPVNAPAERRRKADRRPGARR